MKLLYGKSIEPFCTNAKNVEIFVSGIHRLKNHTVISFLGIATSGFKPREGRTNVNVFSEK
jgi:hypothetical protein